MDQKMFCQSQVHDEKRYVGAPVAKQAPDHIPNWMRR